jgi:hypothetical protein
VEGKRVRVDCQAELCYDRGITKEGGASMGMKDKQLAKEIAEMKQNCIDSKSVDIVLENEITG